MNYVFMLPLIILLSSCSPQPKFTKGEGVWVRTIDNGSVRGEVIENSSSGLSIEKYGESKTPVFVPWSAVVSVTHLYYKTKK
jgi:hypothetical protein